jgi:hypothetical protein
VLVSSASSAGVGVHPDKSIAAAAIDQTAVISKNERSDISHSPQAGARSRFRGRRARLVPIAMASRRRIHALLAQSSAPFVDRRCLTAHCV